MQSQSAVVLNPFARSQELFGRLCDRLQGPEALGSTHVEIEEVLGADGREVMRQLLQDHLDLRGAHEQQRPHASVMGEDGVARPHHRDTTRILRALPGDVTVPRIAYGQRGESSRFPMDAALNLPNDPFSLGVRYAVAFAVATKSYEESALDIEKTTGVHVAKRQCVAAPPPRWDCAPPRRWPSVERVAGITSGQPSVAVKGWPSRSSRTMRIRRSTVSSHAHECPSRRLWASVGSAMGVR